MRVKIKLRDQGCKRQEKFWLLVQPQRKNLKGKYIENIGVWFPKVRKTVKRHIAMNTHRANYWLSVGAIPTKGAHRVLSRFGLLPPLPSHYGSTHAYEKPERIYQNTHFWGFGHTKFAANKVAFHYKQQLQEQMNLVERKRRLANEAISQAPGSVADAASAIDSDAEDTDGIDSDDPDIFERKRKFEKVLKKFNKHREEKMVAFKGNDLRYNVYLKKLEKLSRKDLGLDISAYKDYVNNMKEFAHINKDLNIFAAENIAIGTDYTEKGIVEIQRDTTSQPEIQKHLAGKERVEANSKSILFSLAKFMRTNSGFITQRDHRAVKELKENLNLYILNDGYLCDRLNGVYTRRKKELNELKKQQLMIEELLEQEIPIVTLEEANVSMKELKEIKMLITFDKNIFADESLIHLPNNIEEGSPYSYFVNFDRLPKTIPQKIKQLLYRPERMTRLSKAYQRLASKLQNDWHRRLTERKEWQRNKHKRLDFHSRQPVKTEEEYGLIDSLVKQIEADLFISSEDNLREINDTLYQTKVNIGEYTDVRDWYKPLLTRLIEERRKIPKEERLKQFRDDSVDEVDTTDLENFAFRGVEIDENENIIRDLSSPIEQLNEKVAAEQQMRDRVQSEVAHQNKMKNRRDEQGAQEDRSNGNLSPAQLKQKKKDEIFKIIQDEQIAQKGYQTGEDSEESSSDDDKDEPDFFMQEDDFSKDKIESGYRVQENLGEKEKARYFEVDIEKEQKRIFQRHRIDIAKMYFGKDGGYTIKEFKRIMKTELEEHPERYTLDISDDQEVEKKFKKDLEIVRKQAQANGPIFFDISEDRSAEIKILKEKLDAHIPKIKSLASNNKDYASTLEYARLTEELNRLENQLTKSLQQDQTAIDEDISGVAAAYQKLLSNSTDYPLSPEHLRYMARQCKLLLGVRKFMPAKVPEDQMIDLEIGDRESEAQFLSKLDEQLGDSAQVLETTAGEELTDMAEGDAPADVAQQSVSTNEESIVNEMLGKKIVDAIEGGAAEIDYSELTILDSDIAGQFSGMSDEYLVKQIEKLEKDAFKLEAKLGTMNLRERAAHDKHYPFSIHQFDKEREEIFQLYTLRKMYQQAVENYEGDLVFDKEEVLKEVEIQPELEAAYQKLEAEQNKIVENYARELQADEKIAIPEEEMEKIMQEVINKDGLENSEMAQEFFDGLWEKMQKWRLKTNRQVKTEYLTKEQNDKYKDLLSNPNEYRSYSVDQFLVDQENYDKMHHYNNDKIGRYPHGFRQYENFANYSQLNHDAKIQEYMEDVNRPCELDEYVAIMRQHMVEESQTPEFKWNFRKQVLNDMDRKFGGGKNDEDPYPDIDDDEIHELGENPNITNMVEFIKSDIFVEECRKQFSHKVQEFLVHRETFKLVDALELTMDFWDYGNALYHMPLANSYIPVRNTIMKKPNLMQEDFENDELGYQYNNYDAKETTRKRFHPLDQLSPLRGNRMGPGKPMLTDAYHQKRDTKEHEKKFFKWTRLSKQKTRNFSTYTRQNCSSSSSLFSNDSLVKTSQSGISLPKKFMNIPSLMTAFSPFRQQ